MDCLRENLLLGCGNPLLDISAIVEPSLLQKYGMKENDAVLAEEKHMPLYDELVQKYKVEYIAGGSVQNSLRVCQWILQRPNVTVFFGCVGRDKFSEILEEKSRSDGVNVQYQYIDEVGTGTCAVLITGHAGHRSLCANLSAANHFTIDHLDKDANRAFIENAQYYYISGFFLTVSPPTIMEVARHANKTNRLFMMNLSAPFISQFYTEPLTNVLPFVDILFGNEAEAEAFSESQGWNTKDLREIGKKLLVWRKENSKRPRIVIITQGHAPVLLFRNDSIQEFPVKEVPTEEVVDTNGAGDAFVGGFLAQLVRNESLDICIQCGIWAAGEIIRRSGCTFSGTPKFDKNAFKA